MNPNWGSSRVEALRPYVQQYASGIPGDRAIDRILMWAAIESGGNLCALDGTRDNSQWVHDVGPWQLYFDKPSVTYGGYTSSQLRSMMGCSGTSEKAPAPPVGIDLIAQLSMNWIQSAVADAQSKLDAVGASWSERDTWRWIKGVKHGLPSYMMCVLWATTQRLGRAPVDWDEMKSTAMSLTYDEVVQGAADPTINGCTWLRDWMAGHGASSVGDLGDVGNVWRNAEEMDLFDELNPVQQVISTLFDPINQVLDPNSAPLSILEMGLIAFAAVGGVVGAVFLRRRILPGEPL
jgi:hypothetical protein